MNLFLSRCLLKIFNICYKIYNKALLNLCQVQFKYIGTNAVIESPISLLGHECISIGDNFIIRKDGKIRAYTGFNEYRYEPEIHIGNNVYFGTNCCVSAIGKIKIGNNVTFASNITVIDHTHGMPNYEDINIPVMKRTLSSKGSIMIEDNVWLGEGVVVLSGVTIGENSIIGANAVVTHDIPPFSIAVGVPARIVKTIKK